MADDRNVDDISTTPSAPPRTFRDFEVLWEQARVSEDGKARSQRGRVKSLVGICKARFGWKVKEPDSLQALRLRNRFLRLTPESWDRQQDLRSMLEEEVPEEAEDITPRGPPLQENDENVRTKRKTAGAPFAHWQPSTGEALQESKEEGRTLKRRLAALTRERDQNLQVIDSLNATVDSMHATKEECEELSNSLQQQRSLNATLKAQLESKRREIETVKAERDELVASYNQQNISWNQRSNTITQLLAQVKSQASEIARAKEIAEELEALSEANEILTTACADLDRLREQKAALERGVEVERIGSESETIAELHEKLDKLQKKVHELTVPRKHRVEKRHEGEEAPASGSKRQRCNEAEKQ